MSIDIKILHSACCGPAVPVKEEILKYGTLTFPSIVVNGKVHDYSEFEKGDDLVSQLRAQKVG